MSDTTNPDKTVLQYHRFCCRNCGHENFFITPPSLIDWKKEYKILENKNHRMIGEVNELLAWTALHHGLDPAREKLESALVSIREKYS